MMIDKHKTVGEIVADEYRWLEQFKENGIDFCCGGKNTLQAVCEGIQIDPQQQIENYRALYRVGSVRPSHNFTEWEARLRNF